MSNYMWAQSTNIIKRSGHVLVERVLCCKIVYFSGNEFSIKIPNYYFVFLVNIKLLEVTLPKQMSGAVKCLTHIE